MDGNEVRYSCYNILSKLMDIINIEKFIDKFLNERLCDCVLKRLNDEDSSVRIQAIATIRPSFKSPLKSILGGKKKIDFL